MAELTRGQKRSEYPKMYREAHREEINERDKLYYMNNKDKIAERRLAKHDCAICGGKYTLKHRAQHERTTKHQSAITEATTSTSAK